MSFTQDFDQHSAWRQAQAQAQAQARGDKVMVAAAVGVLHLTRSTKVGRD